MRLAVYVVVSCKHITKLSTTTKAEALLTSITQKMQQMSQPTVYCSLQAGHTTQWHVKM